MTENKLWRTNQKGKSPPFAERIRRPEKRQCNDAHTRQVHKHGAFGSEDFKTHFSENNQLRREKGESSISWKERLPTVDQGGGSIKAGSRVAASVPSACIKDHNRQSLLP